MKNILKEVDLFLIVTKLYVLYPKKEGKEFGKRPAYETQLSQRSREIDYWYWVINNLRIIQNSHYLH